EEEEEEEEGRPAGCPGRLLAPAGRACARPRSAVTGRGRGRPQSGMGLAGGGPLASPAERREGLGDGSGGHVAGQRGGVGGGGEGRGGGGECGP
ncbi:unnamed protein product, partial [Prorocentrum cordatum]